MPLPTRVVLSLLIVLAAATASGQVVTEIPTTTGAAAPNGIAAGSDGNLWFTEFFTNKIGRITPAGVITEFPIGSVGGLPTYITGGPDGNLWFSDLGANKIGRITTAGAVTEFPVLSANAGLSGITTGPDGNLWFAEGGAHKIGRITTAGVVTEFPTLTGGLSPLHIVAGPDGNLWFAEHDGNRIGRITTAGVVTEFPITTAGSSPQGITVGPDGNLWFTEEDGNKIGRITTAGVITEFPIPTAGSGPVGIALGPDGNLWFAELANAGNQIGRITPQGVVTEFPVLTDDSGPIGITAGPDGALWFTEQTASKIGRITTASLTPQLIAVDSNSAAGTNSNVNGVLESGESVEVAPAWKNTLAGGAQTIAFTGTASALTGPAGPTYTTDDNAANYGTVGAGATSDCDADGNCYRMTVSGSRPASHWDATFAESLSTASITKSWGLHIGGSFPDVPTTHPFYAFIETLLHSGVTGGCGSGNYCPTGSVTRAQMAVFLLKGKFGPSVVPAPAKGTVFGDVHIGDFAAEWIEKLAGFQITGGCGSGNYCPANPVTRAQMAVFLLKAKHGSAYLPPDCTHVFDDVPCPSAFANWIEQLATEGITGGCGGPNYCPNLTINRGQMAVFLSRTFGLELYGP